MYILGIETSCDETSASVVVDGKVLSNIISSQLIHQKYGGVVPELASRAHQRLIVPVVNEALDIAGIDKEQLGGVAVTYGPGLMGALLVGLSFAKGLAYGLKIPFVGINHMEAHMYSNFIDDPKPDYPFVCLTVSGGHTQLIYVEKELQHQLLGETLDDAAGEAYDKVAKMLGLGFPGGPIIDKLAKEGNPNFIKFPRTFLEPDSYDFSFSGIKTAVLYWLRDHGLLNPNDHSLLSPVAGGQATHSTSRVIDHLQDICASFQASVVDVLVEKTLRVVKNMKVRNVAIAGGVSANSELRLRLQACADEHGFRLFIPKFQYCTDNGAMIAQLGWMKIAAEQTSDFSLNAFPNLSI